MGRRECSRTMLTLALRCLHALALLLTAIVRFLQEHFDSAFEYLHRQDQVFSVPSHVGLILGTHDIQLQKLALVTRWCALGGANFVTIYDSKGVCVSLFDEIVKQTKMGVLDVCESVTLRTFDREVVLRNDKPLVGHKEPRSVVILVSSGRDGYGQLVSSAKRLAGEVRTSGISSNDITVEKVDADMKKNSPLLRGVDDVDVALVFLPLYHLGGFLPWNTRLTEFLRVGTLSNFSFEHFNKCMQRFGGIEQRFGK
eukprot:c3905_g1_i1.p1 GENE.c3905_g1_i1~~c3905_g1_i1.p1  ORF type:complete len:255 (-),score=27.82 c3905_g1_i1:44-808(-)